MRHLLSVADLGAEGIAEVMRVADSFVEVSARAIPKVPALRGKTVASVFYEDSTRTRLSFEKAAKALSADVMTFSASGSSVKKGESLRDTVLTIEAMGVDAVVVRHRSAGVPRQVAGWLDASGRDVAVVNAGDGWHEHPTQALLDCYTVRQARREAGADGDAGDFRGLSVAIVGDVAHSRVARSNVAAFAALGAGVTLVAPRTFLPPSLEGWPVAVADDLDAVLPTADVVYLLRVQRERTDESLVPTLREYTARYGLTRRRAGLLREGAVVLHPGPMNRGVEIAAEVADLPASLVTRQVANGVAVRMAVLFLLLSGPSAARAEPADAPEGAEPRGGAALAGARLAPPEGVAAGTVLAGAADGASRRAGPRLPTAARAPLASGPAGSDDGPVRG